MGLVLANSAQAHGLSSPGSFAAPANEVHDKPLEGIWTGLRNDLRKFPGVNQVYLAPYVAIFLWA